MTRTSGARGASAYTHTNNDYPPLETDVDLPAGFAVAAEDEAWKRLIDELLRLRYLPDDWDGEGTAAPAHAIVDEAIKLAQALCAWGYAPADRVLAGVNGTIFFEWYAPDGYEEVEVIAPYEAEWRRVRKGSNEAEVAFLSRRS